ncbi:hypothetical protein N7499_006895 [Penicillium canescens]|nr:hypothetical protein N7499_006895 [Penicillium canescens]KAJ6176183.1 hypothetical protein N7485_003097 [Penicillium canescens]
MMFCGRTADCPGEDLPNISHHNVRLAFATPNAVKSAAASLAGLSSGNSSTEDRVVRLGTAYAHFRKRKTITGIPSFMSSGSLANCQI